MMTNSVRQNRLPQFWPASLREFDGLFDHLLGPERTRTLTSWRAPLSIWEADDTFHIELDLPGVAEGAIELTFDKGSLTISAERPAPEGERTSWHNEQRFGKLSRVVALPESADPDSIAADLRQGVLHVTVAKRPEAKPKRIEVKTS